MCSSVYTVCIILFSPLIGSHVHVQQVYITHTSITKCCDILQCTTQSVGRRRDSSLGQCTKPRSQVKVCSQVLSFLMPVLNVSYLQYMYSVGDVASVYNVQYLLFRHSTLTASVHTSIVHYFCFLLIVHRPHCFQHWSMCTVKLKPTLFICYARI